MAIIESGKIFGTEIFRASGNAVQWITTTSKIPFSANQKFAASLIIILFGLWLVQGIEKKAIKVGLSILFLWFIVGFFVN